MACNLKAIFDNANISNTNSTVSIKAIKDAGKKTKVNPKNLVVKLSMRSLGVSPEKKIDEDKKIRPEFDKLPSFTSNQRTMTYAGIGSRNTPKEVLGLMTEAAGLLEKDGYKLQTGKTFNNREEGADKAFSSGTKNKELFGPESATNQTKAIAKELHPAPQNLKEGGLRLMARNTNQIFGSNLDTPVDFVLFYSKETSNQMRPAGGTGQAVEMARRKGIPTINMAEKDWKKQLESIRKKTADTNTDHAYIDKFSVPENITELSNNEIFVFGANAKGIHGKGAAKVAKDIGNIKNGQAVNQEDGQAYGIVTKKQPTGILDKTHLNEAELRQNIYKFIGHAKKNPDKLFLVTAVGTGLAGWKDSDVAPMFIGAMNLDNVKLPRKWKDLVDKDNSVRSEVTKHKKKGEIDGESLTWFTPKKGSPMMGKWIGKVFHTEIEVKNLDEMIELSEQYTSLMGSRHNKQYSKKQIDMIKDMFNTIANSGIPFKPVKIKFNNDVFGKDKKTKILGSATHNRSQIDMQTGQGTRAIPAKIILHEYAHIITAGAIEKSPAMKKKIREIMDRKEVRNLYGDENLKYAFTNEAEFMAEVVSNLQLQQALSKIKSISDKKSSLYDQVIRIFKSALARFKNTSQTALTDSFEIVVELQEDSVDIEAEGDTLVDKLKKIQKELRNAYEEAGGCKT